MTTDPSTGKYGTDDFNVQKIENFLSRVSILIIRLFSVLIVVAFGSILILTTLTDFPVSSFLHRTNKADRRDGSDGSVDQWEVISWEPRAVIYHNFLSQDECEHLINIAKPHIERSTALDITTGKRVPNRVRTSSATFLTRGRDKTVRAIEKKIANFTILPVEHGEGLQVLHYEVGQQQHLHYDYFLDDYNTRNGGQRMVTVLMYLSDVEEGGKTVFPSANGNFSGIRSSTESCDSDKKGLSVKPKMGDALFFWSLKPDATLDRSSLHGECPVVKGNKWTATTWIRVKKYNT